ncbi:universal stress protein UspA [Halobacteriales archaeon SW_7_68_16]|nr:MAG: universal stress protein UspA [Halobacteriales archaeon SW_7_68_16]
MRVLIGYDDSPQADAALAFAVERFGGENLVALTVIDPVEAGYASGIGLPSTSEQWYDEARETARDELAAARDRAAEAGVELDTAVEVGRPARTIVTYAEEHDVDHVVLGSHGRSGVSRILLGSVAESVLRRSPVRVTVIR